MSLKNIYKGANFATFFLWFFDKILDKICPKNILWNPIKMLFKIIVIKFYEFESSSQSYKTFLL